MVTGDQAPTAKAIAKQIGIIKGKTIEDIAEEQGKPVDMLVNAQPEAIVVHGEELKDMSDDKLAEILSKFNQIVFARTTPTQKLRIAEINKGLGRIVAMT